MHHVRLAATTLVLCGASAWALETGIGEEGSLAPEITFASASGMENWPSRSPLGSLAFGRVPPPVMTEAASPAALTVHAVHAVKGAAAQAEEAVAGGMNEARPVPEPPTLLMLMAGLGVLAVVISRRQ